MYAKQSKKMMTLDILEILRRYTDENHSLSQKDIEKLLEKEYDMVVDRKSVKRNIMELIDMGFDIQWAEKTRMVFSRDTGEMEEQTVCTGFYLQREIMDCEIHFLIDSVLDADCISDHQKKQLVEKLESLSSKYFRKNTGASRKNMKEKASGNQMFYTLDIINEAIATKKNVQFSYRTYQAGRNGLEERYEEYIVTPYETEIINGKYLLLCRDEDGADREFRIDYISEMRMVGSDLPHRRGLSTVKRTVNEQSVKFMADEDRVSSFVEFFGRQSLKVSRMENGDILVSTRTDPQKALEFALSHSMDVTIIEPQSLRNRVVAMLQSSLEGYIGNSCGRVG